MNALALTFEGHRVRIVWRDGDPWWVLVDICEMLDHSNPSMIAGSLDPDERDALSIADPIGREQQTTIISEPGLYKILQNSRKPFAKRFDRWVRHEVLPEVRRTGSYQGGNIEGTLSALFNEVREQTEIVRRTDSNVIELKYSSARIEQRMDDAIPRKNASEKNRRIYIYTIHKRFDGYCPCGCETRLLDKNGKPLCDEHGPLLTEDHWSSRERNGIDFMWIVFRDCNQKMKDDDFRRSKHARYMVFHEERKKVQHQVDARKKIKKGKTPTILHPDQGNFLK